MLFVSYAAAASAMIAAGFYLILRLRFFVATTTMLFFSLLLIYGPAFLSFTLSGEYALLLRPFTGGTLPKPWIFAEIKARSLDLNAIIIAMNFSVALMYACIIAGVEAVNRIVPARVAATEVALRGWTDMPLRDDGRDRPVLLVVICVLFVLMLYFSISENHLGTILHFFAIKDDNTARNLFRAHFGGSPDYLYRVTLAAVAPMFVIWGLLAGLINRHRLLLVATGLLLAVTMLGKLETLSKAPPAFFLLQVVLAVFLAFTNRISWKVALSGAGIAALVIYVTTRAFVILPPGYSAIEFVYSRIFDIENHTLVENFAVFPYLHPFMWGTNLRPIAILMGVPYEPAYNIVGYTWYNSHDITSPSLFIADAWADFSYAGVIFFSIVAGAICRALDIVFLSRGKSVASIAVLAAASLGVLTLLTTALNIALLSGGLLLAPLLAGAVMLASRRLNRAT